MEMIFKTTTIICAFFLCLDCTSAIAQTTQVSGRIVPGNSYAVELWTYDIGSDKYLHGQTINTNSDGEFSFEIAAEPNLYKLEMNGNKLEFVCDGDESIQFEIDLTGNAAPVTIKGSRASQYLLEFVAAVGELQQKLLAPLEPKMAAAMASGDQAQIEAVELEHQQNLGEMARILDEKISAMGSSLAVFSIIRTLDFNKYLANIEKWELAFVKDRPDSPFTKMLHTLIEDTRRLQPGAMAPEIVLITSTGEQPRKLSELRGKMVLVDFWASW